MQRICFQVEEAQWFYEDFIRPLDPNLPSMSLRQFALRSFQHCPLMSGWSHDHHTAAFSEFLAYKTRVPVRGAVLLNESMDEVVLVKGWKKSAHWSFPRGKINKDEKDLDCAVREVHEETGLDIKAAGLVDDEKSLKYIEIPMREQNMRLYVVRGVPMDTHFEPRTRKEISKIDWYKLSELPTVKKSKQVPLEKQNTNGNTNKFYMVAPFLGPLRKWIAQQRKLDLAKEPTLAANFVQDEEGVEPVDGAVRHTNEQQVPSDLPEVSTHLPPQEDPSAHMKRLLNISTDPNLPQGSPASSKADALLTLLREGSEEFNSQAPVSDRPVAVSSHPASGPSQPLPYLPHHPGTLQPSPFGVPHDQSYLATIHKAGLPGNGFNQSYRLGTENRSSQPPQRPYQGPSMNQLHRHQSHYSQNPLQNVPAPSVSLQQPPTGRQNPSFGSAQPTMENKQTPAPYQLTGDPQFAQGSRFPNAELLSGPPASKLPLPKLTNHSRALLDVFKNDSAKKREPAAPELPSQPVTQRPPENGAKSQQQNNLLKLLQQQQQQQQQQSTSSGPATTTEFPQSHAELATAPSPLSDTSKPEPVKILKREGTTSPKSKPQGTTPKVDEATLSGPINLPNFEAAKSGRKQAAQSAKDVHKDAKKDKPTNITILPRPDQARKSSPATAPTAETAPSSQPSPPRRNVKLADFAKPAKPKILRRPEKGNLDACLPTHTVAVSAFSWPENEETESEQKDESKQVNYDRRPSQPTSQKEALLSLFGKKSGSTTASVPCSPEEQQRPALSPPSISPTRSNVISPLPSGSPPAPGITTTSQPQSQAPAAKVTSPVTSGESASKDRGKVTSPGDKAFLLDYLAGVAKGNR